MSAPAWPVWLAAPPAQSAITTLDSSQTLNFSAVPGTAASQLATGADGTIVNNNGAGEARWYKFTLQQASDVQLATLDAPGGRHLQSVLSLFNSEAQDPSYPLSFTAPPFDPQQHRLLTQGNAPSAASSAYLDRQLAAGTYYVAVSGQGDSYFNPFLADSGYAGSTGDFRLLVTANPLPMASTDGPTVLTVDPGLSNATNGVAVVHGSPLAIDVDLSGPIDPSSVSLMQSPRDGSSVQLTYNPTGNFGNGNDSLVVLNGFHYAADAMELQLQTAAPMGPGFYQLTLMGNSSSGNRVLTDPTGAIHLGQNQANPMGRNFTTTFQIVGREGTAGAVAAASDDAPAAAHNLGNITQSGLVQTAGAIGDDPAYNPNAASAFLNNPASDVDLYHFRISGSGLYDLGAEVFAGRIGSTLDAALSLFRVDASNARSPLQLVASNDNSGNQAASSDGRSSPLFTDPLLDVGLTVGDYYLAVSSSGNMPELHGNPPGTNGVFDPNVSHSGSNGSTTGNYVLNVLVQPAAPAPHVVSTSISAGATLTAAPTQLTVTFDGPVNVTALANQAFQTTNDITVSGVYFTPPHLQHPGQPTPASQTIYPRLLSYNAATNQAVFLMLDRLPNGVNQLHLSGAAGLTGLGGAPLVGNDPSGDYVVSFTVNDPSAPADPRNYSEQASSTNPNSGQSLGVLFPHELQSGVTVTGVLTGSTAGNAPVSDAFTIQVLSRQDYHFTLSGPAQFVGGPAALPNNVVLTITKPDGSIETASLRTPFSTALSDQFGPGIYTIRVTRPTGNATLSVTYELHVTMLQAPENPPPLSVGVTPVLRIRTAGNLPSPPPVGSGDGSNPVTPVAYTLANPVENQVASLGAGSPTQLALGATALSLRADLVGGLTNNTASNLAVAAGPPLQVQGLTNGPTFVASGVSGLSAISLSLFVDAPSGSDAQLSGDDAAPIDSIWPSLKDWLDTRTHWLQLFSRADFLTNVDPQPAFEQPSGVGLAFAVVPPIGDRLIDLSGSSTTLPDSAQLHQSAASTFDVPVRSAETTTASIKVDVSHSVTKEPVRNSFAWIGALFGTGMAAVMIWGRTFQIPGSRNPLNLPKKTLKQRK